MPPFFQAKARRYAVLWRERYSHLGFARTLPDTSGVDAPGKLEQWLDQVRYGGWLRLDYLKFLLFRHLPLNWWRWCRRLGQPHAKSGVISMSP